MQIETALQLVEEHYNNAKSKHPVAKNAFEWPQHIHTRLDDTERAASRTDIPDAKLIAGKRYLQVAAMALRAIEDLGLGLVGPDYDASNLPHGSP